MKKRRLIEKGRFNSRKERAFYFLSELAGILDALVFIGTGSVYVSNFRAYVLFDLSPPYFD